MNKQRISWLDGLKGLGCMIVFWNHFYLIMLGNSRVAMEQIHSSIPTFFNIANVLVNGNLGVCFFVVASGYLAAQKQINSVGHLLKEILLRYLRFVFALLFVTLLVIILDLVVGFQTESWGAAFDNQWIVTFYTKDFTITDYLKFIFLFDIQIDGPIRTFAPIFIGNALVYTLNFVTGKLPEIVRVLVAIVFVVAGMVFGYPGHGTVDQIILYSGACFVGVLLPHAWKLLSKWKEWILVVLLVCAVIGVSGGYRYVVSYASMVVHVPDVFYSQIYWNLALALVIMCLIGKSRVIQKGLSNSILLMLNKLSFPIYLLHWPLLCSIGIWMHRVIAERVNYTVSFVLMFVVMHIITLVSAWLYNRSWNVWSEKLLRTLKNKLEQIR